VTDMIFVLVSLVSAGAVFLALSLHRFLMTREEARENILVSAVAGKYGAWIAGRSVEILKRTSVVKWRATLEGLAFWKYPGLEKWLFAAFYGSFAYLAASGFFYAFFVPRGLTGYPLLLHVVAGAFFAVSLAAIVLLRAKNYVLSMGPPTFDLAELNLRRLGITAANVQRAAFWIFALSGFLLTASALFPMLPVFRTPGQKLMFELHRYGALAAVLAGAVFVELESFNEKYPQSQS
jgi:hypothetical protein